MFFSNLSVYRITQALNLDVEALQTALSTKPAREPASQEFNTYGFTAPAVSTPDSLTVVAGDCILICARKEERNLPASAVRDKLKKKVDGIEAEQLRKVYKKERDQLKDEIIQAMLPHAFLKRKVTYAAIDQTAGLIYVNTASPREAEDLLSTLREVLGTLPVRPVTVKISPSACMTEWLTRQKAPEGFFVLDECELRDTHEDGGLVRCKRQDLTAEEIQLHLSTGKQATSLSLAYEDKLSFVLTDKLAIRRLRFEDLLTSQAEADAGEGGDAHDYFIASFTIMVGVVRDFWASLVAVLGGEEEIQALGATSVPASDSDTDPLYQEAVTFVRESDRASISAVQRKLKIGYNRAARFIEDMTIQGIVTAMNSHGQRQVIR